MVIWPEDSADIDPSTDPYIYATISDAVAAIDRPVLIGTLLQNPLRNAGQLWLPGRGPVAIYVKRQLVPFGEYIPFRGLISSFSSLPSLQPVNFTAGHKAVVFHIGKVRLGDVICYEVGFDNLVSSEVTAGANLLTEQTNDADFELDGQLGETLQQLAMARIRAIEFDRSMVVAGTTGVSAIIAPDGTLISQSRTWQRALLEARVPLLSNSHAGRTARRVARDRVQRAGRRGAGRGCGQRDRRAAPVAARPTAAACRQWGRTIGAGPHNRTVAFWRAFGRPVRYAALVAGALPALAFPAPNLEFVAWFGLVPGMLLFRSAPSAREAAVRGWWFGAGFLLASLYWLAPNLGPGLLLIAAFIGALWTIFGAATWGLLRPPITPLRALAALAVVPSCWLVADWVRSWQGFGGPWAVYGASQWQHPAILALAALGGVWLVGFALVAANTGILIALAARPIPVRLIGAACALIALAAGPVAFALTSASPVSRHVTIALVQPGVVHNPTVSADASQRLSAGLRGDHADLIVWGESSVAST